MTCNLQYGKIKRSCSDPHLDHYDVILKYTHTHTHIQVLYSYLFEICNYYKKSLLDEALFPGSECPHPDVNID